MTKFIGASLVLVSGAVFVSTAYVVTEQLWALSGAVQWAILVGTSMGLTAGFVLYTGREQ